MSDERISGGELEAALSAIADQSRLSILQALWELDGATASFSEIRAATGIDDSGKFNYHLDKLKPEFVRKEDDGYRLTSAGRRVIGAAVSGQYTANDISVDSVEQGTCPDCGATLETTYEAGTVTVACLGCGDALTKGMNAPPVLASNAEHKHLPQLFSRLVLTKLQQMARGFCPLCGGHTERSLLRDIEKPGDFTAPLPWLQLICQACDYHTSQPVGALVLDHPAVIGFLFENGLDIRTTPLWEFEWLTEDHATVTNEEPLRVEITVDLGNARMDVALDEQLTVDSYERVS
ncbi:winged helix-turn-helix domain-containing protein [Halovenus salina]|uniref:Winged helix-turn-helix domain-containing protein n=1 Tax=Halovenus salina TaxID=1510225 RepID=A0ABD5VYP0_9EURY|nr:helix-turn-helix domain-containing protein [Halovenus salina]